MSDLARGIIDVIFSRNGSYHPNELRLQAPTAPIICPLILEAGSREAARGLPCGLKFEFQAMRGRNEEASLFTLSSAKICSREVA